MNVATTTASAGLHFTTYGQVHVDGKLVHSTELKPFGFEQAAREAAHQWALRNLDDYRKAEVARLTKEAEAAQAKIPVCPAPRIVNKRGGFAAQDIDGLLARGSAIEGLPDWWLDEAKVYSAAAKRLRQLLEDRAELSRL